METLIHTTDGKLQSSDPFVVPGTKVERTSHFTWCGIGHGAQGVVAEPCGHELFKGSPPTFHFKFVGSGNRCLHPAKTNFKVVE